MVKFTRKFFFAVITVFVVAGATTAVAFAQDPDNGKVLWEEQVWQCAQCHGDEGEGKFAGPLTNSTATAEEWIEQVRTPRRFMPAFIEGQVSDEQVTDMHAYITALPEPTGEFVRADSGIPADAPEGQQLMGQKGCVACHGAEGPINGYIERGQTPTADDVIAQLRFPFQAMPSYTTDQVSDAEATLMAEFMAAQVSGETPPAALPQAGHDTPTNTPLLMLLFGAVAVVAGGLMARRVVVRS